MGVGTLTVPAGTFHLSGNPIRVNIAGATIPAGATDYKILCKITSVDELLIGAPFIDAKTPVTGAASFDVAGYVDQPVDFVFQYPLTGMVSPRDSHTLDVKFQPGERYIESDGDLVEAWGSESAAHYVLKGGVSFIDLGQYTDDSTTFYAKFVTDLNFLTRIPTNRVVHPYQPNKLCFVSHTALGLSISINAFYDDGHQYAWSQSFATYENIMHEMNASPYLADSTNMAPVIAGSKMLYFDYMIIEGGQGPTILAEMRFYVDHNYYENCNYLFAVNSLGGMDCIWLNGAVEKGFKVSQVFANKPWPSTGTRKTRTKVVSNKMGSRTWKINTGYKSAEEMSAMPDLLLSKQVWLLENASAFNTGTLYPVIIANAEALVNNTMDDLHSLELEIEEAHDNKYF